MTWLAALAAIGRAASAVFTWLTNWQIFRSGYATAERDSANEKLSKLDKVRRFRDRVDSDPRYSAELRQKYGDDGLRVPPKAEDKPS